MKTRIWIHVMLVSGLSFALAAGPGDKPSAGQADGAAKAAEAATKAADKAAADATKADADAAGAKNPDTDKGKAADDADAAADKADKAAGDAEKAAEKAAKDAEAARKEADKTGTKDDRDKADKADKDAADAAKAAADAEKAAGEADKAADTADDKASPFDNKKLKKKARDARRDARKKRRAAAAAIRFAKKCAEMLDDSSKKGKEKKDKMIETLDAERDHIVQLAFAPPGGGDTVATLGGGRGGQQLTDLVKSGRAAIIFTGTGKTIGNGVVNMTVVNLSAAPLIGIYTMPAGAQSTDGSCQDYAFTSGLPTMPGDPPPASGVSSAPLPSSDLDLFRFTAPIADTLSVNIDVGKSMTVARSGVCLQGDRNPATAGKSGQLQAVDSTAPGFATGIGRAIKDVQATVAVVRRLQAEGKFTTAMSGNPANEATTLIQWDWWRKAAAEAGHPLTEANLAEKVFKQAAAAAGGELTQAQKDQMQPGIHQIWTSLDIIDKAKMGVLK